MVTIDPDFENLLESLSDKYTKSGPYYTSYPSVGQWSKNFKAKDYESALDDLFLDNKDVPFWNINLIKDELITTYPGKDETGDIYNIMNMLEFIKDVGKNTCTIVTSDGGFDYSGNFNDQELSSYKLIRNEMFMALNLYFGCFRIEPGSVSVILRCIAAYHGMMT